ncbi:MAG: alpha-ketoacid dehydrogenase subunit beta [Candidatus Tectomicrobia bacterium]|nr:alpha-ketoacid dehydrogenase subunit beta [Candidatus Tectomicrobia bacterium]
MATQTQTRDISLTQALNEAMREEMRRDERVFIMGEDIRSGVYGASGGLFSEFGENRVLDCPLSENAFVGAAVGAAAVGTRPIVESASCFLWVAMDSLISQAAKMRYMFGGQVDLPIVYRMSMYYGGSMAAHHSDRSHPIFMHIPGFKVVIPSTAYDGKGLLKTAIREDDPVIFCEDRTILGARGHVPEEEYSIPFGEADIKREGSDVTIVAIGGMVTRALQAAEALAGEGISAEVLDPRTLVPLDKQAILDSVAKTGRLVTVDMAHKTCSAASEIAAIVAMEGFWDLQAPIQRVGTANVHIPFSTALEPLCYPTAESIADAARVTME